MRFDWFDADVKAFDIAESWIDDETRSLTGLDDGWKDYYDYYVNDENSRIGENFWCKMICQSSVPVAMIALCLTDENVLYVSEYTVALSERNKGIGSSALKELLENTEEILGKSITCSRAVIFPNNIASQRAFERAGYIYESAHPDGDAWYYVWKPTD